MMAIEHLEMSKCHQEISNYRLGIIFSHQKMRFLQSMMVKNRSRMADSSLCQRILQVFV